VTVPEAVTPGAGVPPYRAGESADVRLAAEERDQPRVLVVDDTDGNRYAVARALRGAGMRVTEAPTGTDAIRLAAALPDLIVLDINLPDMTGHKVAHIVKHDPATSHIPVMHVSASFTGSADRAFGLDSGADAYLTHPIDVDVLVATARALLRLGRAERRLRLAAHEWVTTFDAIGDAIFLVNDAGVVKRSNRAAANLVQRPASEMVGQSIETLIDAAFGEGQGKAVARVATGLPVRGVEMEIGDRWFSVNADRVGRNGDVLSSVVCVLTDIGLRKAGEAERDLLLQRAEAARLDAENANRAKSDFLAVASHELRTPLNAIGGFAQLIALGIRGPVTEAQQADLEKIHRSQVALTALINDLLSFARLERGAVSYDVETVVVGDVVARAGEMIEEMLRERGITFVRPARGRGDGLAARGDADKMQQILLNLLSNALKFTGEGGTVELTYQKEGDTIEIRVADTGRGIPEDKLEAIFHPFVQVDQRRIRDQAGIGLGLSISRDLARGMGGELSVVSTVGSGSVFTLSIPAD
jgi:signal transduction histidine kinase/DNA-binding response OmpR family regulator